VAHANLRHPEGAMDLPMAATGDLPGQTGDTGGGGGCDCGFEGMCPCFFSGGPKKKPSDIAGTYEETERWTWWDPTNGWIVDHEDRRAREARRKMCKVQICAMGDSCMCVCFKCGPVPFSGTPACGMCSNVWVNFAVRRLTGQPGHVPTVCVTLCAAALLHLRPRGWQGHRPVPVSAHGRLQVHPHQGRRRRPARRGDDGANGSGGRGGSVVESWRQAYS